MILTHYFHVQRTKVVILLLHVPDDIGTGLQISFLCNEQGLTNPLSGCPRQVNIFVGQVKYFLTCPEKCIRYIGKPKEIQYFAAEELHRTSRSNFDLSSPE